MSGDTKFDRFEDLLEKIRQEIRQRFHELGEIIKRRESELLKDLESFAHPFVDDRRRQEAKLAELRNIYEINERNFKSNELQSVQNGILKGLTNEIDKLKKELVTLPFEFSFHHDILKNLKQFGEIKLTAAKEPIQPSPCEKLPPVPAYAPPIPIKKPSSIYASINHPIYGVCNKGSGSEDLDRPWGISINYQTGNIFVADQCNSRVQVFNNDGTHLLSYLVSSGRGQMKWPLCIAIHNEKLFISQHGNDCVSVVGMRGTFINQFGKSGRKNGEFKSPRGINIQEITGDIFVCDFGNNRMQVFTPEYKLKSKFGNLYHPMCVQLSLECIIVLDQGNPCVHVYNFDYSLKRSIISHGLMGQVRSTRTFCLDSEGNILLTDYDSNCICIFKYDGSLVHQIFKGVIAPVGISLDTRGRIIVVSHRDDNCLQFF